MKFLFLSMLVLSATKSFAVDVVKMKNGDVYRGEIIKQEFEKKIQIVFKDGNEKSLQWSEIETIEKEAPVPLPQAEAQPRSSVNPVPSPVPEQAKEEIDVNSTPLWRAYFRPGVTVANSSSYTVKSSGGTSLIGSSDNAKPSLLLGAELAFQPHRIFGVSLIFDWSKYNYKDTTPADTELGFFVMPKAQVVLRGATLWAGMAAGLSLTSLGLFSQSTGNFTVTFEQSVTSFGLSPRIGADFDLAKRLSLGLEIFYFFTSGNISGNVLNRTNGASADFSEDVSRKWLGIAARLGFAL